MSRKSFVLYTEWEDAFDGQPNDVAGELIKAIFDYVRTDGVPTTNNDVVKAMFSILRPAIDRNLDKYEEIVEKRREAGRIGGLKKAEKYKQTLANVASDSKYKQTLANVAVSDSVSDSVSTNVDEKKSIKEKATRFSPPTLEEVRAYCQERKNNIDPERFIDFYTCNGWMAGKNKMKDWKAAIRNWARNEKKGGSNESTQEYIIPD